MYNLFLWAFRHFGLFVCLFAFLCGAGVRALVPVVGSPRDYSPAAPVYTLPPHPFLLKHFRKYMEV